MLTTGARVSARWEGEREVPVRRKGGWAAGWFPDWADSVPRGPFLFLFFFLLFPFSDFLFPL
jgi:hypothetical protein